MNELPLLKKIDLCKNLLSSLADAGRSLNTDSEKQIMLLDADKTVNALQMLLEVQITNLNRTANNLPPNSPNPSTQYTRTHVAHVLSAQDLLFYTLDSYSPLLKALANLGNNKDKLKPIEVSPKNYDTIFGLYLDDALLRAKYIKHSDKVLLIDFREEIREDESTQVKYKLSQEIQDMPVKTKLCKLIGVEDEPYADLAQLLSESLYKDVSFKIVKTEHGINYVEFAGSKREKDNALPLFSLTQDVDDLDASWQQLEQGTDNAEEAVLGYAPKDAQRLCRFCDAKLGACFKGAKCFKDHILPAQDGETKDCVPAALATDFNIKFGKQQVLNITVTHMINLVSFYAQVNGAKNEPVLIWSDEQIPKFKRFEFKQQKPGLEDLVLARYKDNRWYRARVIELVDDFLLYKVFFVDYGNTAGVRLNQLAYCFENVRQHPERARLMFLGGYVQNTKSHIQYLAVRQRYFSKFLNKTFDVRVLSHDMELEVEYMRDDQQRMFEYFLRCGYVKKIENQEA